MQQSEVKVWIAASVAAEEKPVLAVVEVQRSRPVAESGKNIRIKGKILRNYEAIVNIIAETIGSRVLEVKCLLYMK